MTRRELAELYNKQAAESEARLKAACPAPGAAPVSAEAAFNLLAGEINALNELTREIVELLLDEEEEAGAVDDADLDLVVYERGDVRFDN